MNADRAPFKAILWKEIRENLKWAVLGLSVVSVGVVYVLLRLIDSSAYGGDLNWPDLSLSLFGMTLILPPVVGVMIGVAQVIFENRGDSWGFLTHRPVRRSTLFWGKAVAGILLYMTAVSVPLACGLLWIATPGHLAMPFDVHFVLPVIADVLCGLVYYFAGLLTGMREARWYASRVMGVGMGIVCSIVLSVVPEFWQAVACCAVGILMTSASAWGTFVQGGRFESQSPVMRFATGVSVGAGLLITGAIIYLTAASFVSPIAAHTTVKSYVVTSNGEIVQVVREGAADVEIQDLEGKTLDRYRDLTDRRLALSHGVVATQAISPWDRSLWPGTYRTSREFSRPFQSNDVLSNGRSFTWYYMPRLGRIAAYENRSAKLIGWMGPGGFTSGSDMPSDQFERPLAGVIPSWPTLISFTDAVYRLDLGHRHIEKIFSAEAGESVIGASDSERSEFGEKARFVAISTTERVVVQSPDGTVQLSEPHDPNAARYTTVKVYRALQASDSPTFVWYTLGLGTPVFVTRVGSSNLATQYTLPGLLRPEFFTWGFVLIRSIMENNVIRIASWHGDDAMVQLSSDQTLVSWLIPILEGVLFAALAFARGRRYAFSSGRLSLWTAIGFALGPLGYALMLSLLEWPAFENCPGCGQPRLVTRDSCEHCSKPFTAPRSDGTEVFEVIAS